MTDNVTVTKCECRGCYHGAGCEVEETPLDRHYRLCRDPGCQICHPPEHAGDDDEWATPEQEAEWALEREAIRLRLAERARGGGPAPIPDRSAEVAELVARWAAR